MQLSKLADFLTTQIDRIDTNSRKEELEVNPLISEVAAWYEKLRNAMEYKEEEVVLRAAVQRILKRRLFIYGSASSQTLGPILVRELTWAKYFPEGNVPEAVVNQVDLSIKLFLDLEQQVLKNNKAMDSSARIGKSVIHEWTIHLLSAEIERTLKPNQEKELMCNFIFQLLKGYVTISDEDEQTKDAQVYISVRRSFAKEDIPMLRYCLFLQYFGKITEKNVGKTAENFIQGCTEINQQLNHPLKDRVYSIIKSKMPPFIILEDIFKDNSGKVREFTKNEPALLLSVTKDCARRYDEISKKVSRAVMRSVIFIFFTKVVFALTLETTFETFLFGSVNWFAISINTLFSPVLMILSSFFITVPNQENTKKISQLIQKILYEEDPVLGKHETISQSSLKLKSSLYIIYGVLWFAALTVGILAVNFLLAKLYFNPISKIVFIFFFAVVSFLSYRISQTAKSLTLQKERQGFRSTAFDFFFVPFIQIGKYLTIGVSQINIFIFIFDYLIETPFKEMFAFIEQWLFFLRSQRETLD